MKEFCSELPSSAERESEEVDSQAQKYYLPALSQTKYYDREAEGLGPRMVNLAHHISPKSSMEDVPEDLIMLHDYGPCGRFDFPTNAIKTDSQLMSSATVLERRVGFFFKHIESTSETPKK